MTYDLRDVLKWECMMLSSSSSPLDLPDETEEENEEQNDVSIAGFPAFTHLPFWAHTEHPDLI